MQDGKLTPFIMSERHNCTNSEEVLKLAREHPNEENPVINRRVLGILAITRGRCKFARNKTHTGLTDL
jgi:hypothetical protein